MSETPSSGNLMLTTLKWVAVAAGIKGVCQLWYYYNLMITDRAVQDLRNAYSTGPKLITNGPHSVQILDESGFASGARVPPPTQKRAPSTTIRILSVTSRSATAWVKEENRDGLYAVERASGKVHLFIQPRWRLSPSIGPACTQLEAFLRLHKIPYTVHVVNVLCAQGSEQAARVEDIPQESQSAGQRELGEEERQRRAALSSHRSLPFVVYKGEVVMGTFDVLTRYLEKKFNLPPPSYHADKEACAVAQALSRTLEFSLHMEYSVGMLLDSPSLFSKYAAGAMGVPGWVMRVWVGIPFLSGLVSDVRRSLKVHDLGYLTKSQLDASFLQQVKSLESLLEAGEGPFFFGKTPNKEDCVLYAYVMPILSIPFKEIKKSGNKSFIYIASSQVFSDFVHEMTRLLFPDFKRMFGSLLGDTSAATALARRQGEQLRNKANQRHRAALGTKGTASLNSTFTEVKTEARPTQPAARPQPPVTAASPSPVPPPQPQPVTSTKPEGEFALLSASAIRKTRPQRTRASSATVSAHPTPAEEEPKGDVVTSVTHKRPASHRSSETRKSPDSKAEVVPEASKPAAGKEDSSPNSLNNTVSSGSGKGTIKKKAPPPQKPN